MNPQQHKLIKETLERKADEYILADRKTKEIIDKHVAKYLNSYVETDEEIVKSLRVYYEIRKGD